jgi:hypothetical protein
LLKKARKKKSKRQRTRKPRRQKKSAMSSPDVPIDPLNAHVKRQIVHRPLRKRNRLIISYSPKPKKNRHNSKRRV